MRIYHPHIQAIIQQTKQLENEACHHCQRTRQLVSHGFIYKKRALGIPLEVVGKRVFCSNRNQRTGCGRTLRLYLDIAVRYLHYIGEQVVAFVFALMSGMRVQQAYFQSTGTADPRHAYRWLRRLRMQLSSYRSLMHQPPLSTCTPRQVPVRPAHSYLLKSTFAWLLQHFGEPLCARYQSQLQRTFLT
jgi:hypothetical protein